MEFHGYTSNGKLMLSTAQQIMRANFLESMGTCNATETITRVSKPKTHQQVKMHFGLVISMIKYTFDERGIDLACLIPGVKIPPGQPVPKDVIQRILYACCNDVGDEGERKTLSKMNTIEASRFFEACRNYAARMWHIQIPEPDINWKDNADV